MSRMIFFFGQAALLLLAGCSLDMGNSLGVAGVPGNAQAMIVGDEPYAVRAGAAVLSEGGTAADAAVATYFALAVTFPVAAALGGGGICIVRDATGRSDEVDFPASNPAGGGAYAVPANVRGFGRLQTNYGTLPWQRDLVAAERLAAGGFPISRALSSRLVTAQNVVRLDASLAAEFMDESGQPKAEGTIVQSRELAETLSQIRTRGADAFYQSEIAERLASYASTQGGALAQSDVRSYQAVESAPRSIPLNDQMVLVPSGAHHVGAFASALFERLPGLKPATGDNRDPDAMGASLAATQVLAGVAKPTDDFGSTGFAARDANGGVVVCAVTMGSPFGSGHTASGTGIVLSRAPPSDTGTAAAFLSPVIVVSSGRALLAGVGAGGAGATEAIATAALRLSHKTVLDGSTWLRDHDAMKSDTINAIVCQPTGCLAHPDPSGTGLGQSADVVP